MRRIYEGGRAWLASTSAQPAPWMLCVVLAVACCSCQTSGGPLPQRFLAANGKVALNFDKTGGVTFLLNDGSEIEYHLGTWTRSGKSVVCAIQGERVSFKVDRTRDGKVSLHLAEKSVLSEIGRGIFDTLYIEVNP